MYVDANADNEMTNARHLCIEFCKNAAEFARPEQKIVRPSQIARE